MEQPCNSFVAAMEAIVIPMMLQNPGHLRLDGRESGGNWEEVAGFRFGGDIWRLFADNRYEPLLLAYYSARFRGEDQTFLRVLRDRGDGDRLDLLPDLERVRPSRRGRYLCTRTRRVGIWQADVRSPLARQHEAPEARHVPDISILGAACTSPTTDLTATVPSAGWRI